jgi:hypothetical protein
VEQYFHVVFTLPQQIAAMALQNAKTIYGILFRAVAETMLTIASRPPASGCDDRLPGRASHLGSKSPCEPSLMMPGIIISSIFSEQGGLVVRATPSQN